MSTQNINMGSRRERPHAVLLAVIGENGLPVSVGPEANLPVSNPDIPGGAIPKHDTIIDSPSNALTAGGTRTWKAGGPSGSVVAQITVTVSGGNTTIQRTA